MLEIVNIDNGFDRFDDLFSPKIVGELNGQLAAARGHVPIAVVEAWRARAGRPLDRERAMAFDQMLVRLGDTSGASLP